MRKPNRRCCFEQNSAGRPNVNRLKVAAVLAIRDIGIPKPLNVEFHLCLHIEIGHGKSGMMRSEEHTSELQSLMRISYAVFCLKKKNKTNKSPQQNKLSKLIKRIQDDKLGL